MNSRSAEGRPGAAERSAQSESRAREPAAPDRASDRTARGRLIAANEPRNLALLAVHQVVMRIGWIFKTESVIIPAFLDAIAGAGWIRGCLPVINRFAQSIPPVILARRLTVLRRKKGALAAVSLLMAAPFLVLALVWSVVHAQPPGWLPWLFLALYAVLFVANGLHQVTYGTLQGKLIHATRRGRLLAISVSVGSLLAVLFAAWLMFGWLARPDGGFGMLFAFTACCFVLAAAALAPLIEPTDRYDVPPVSVVRSFAQSLGILRNDPAFRKLAVVILLFTFVLFLFPHYQALGRERLKLAGTHLATWVIVQNLAVGVISLLAGPLADRRGNRLTLRLLIFATAATPLLSLALLALPVAVARNWFWIIFLPLGVTPVVLKTLMNYTLEICEPEDHPRYLGAMFLCLSAPFVLSPAVGWMIDATSFEVVLSAGAALILAAGVMTFRLAEPRHHAPGGLAIMPDLSED